VNIGKTKTSLDINKLKIASPCPMSWDAMTGDAKVRRCGACDLNIYNTAEMTSAEVKSLILQRDGRLCIRIYRRSDGTVMTRDCPVGLRAVKARVGRLVTAAIATLLGFFTVSFAQKREWPKASNASSVMIEQDNKTGSGRISGSIIDPNGAVIPDATVRLFTGNSKDAASKENSDIDGHYDFNGIASGVYKIEVSVKGFKKHVVSDIKLSDNQALELNVNMEPSQDSVTVGIYVEDPMIDLTVTGPSPVIITRKMMDRIPGGRPF
jgi:hypothetical protein